MPCIGTASQSLRDYLGLFDLHQTQVYGNAMSAINWNKLQTGFFLAASSLLDWTGFFWVLRITEPRAAHAM